MNKHERTRTQLFDKLLAISPELGDVREKLHEGRRDQFDDGFVKARHVAGELGIIDPDADAPAVHRAIVRYLMAEHDYDQAQVEAMSGEQLAEVLQDRRAVDDIDLEILRTMATRPDRLWTREQVVSESGHRVKARTFDNRRQSLLRMGYLFERQGVKGVAISERGLKVVERYCPDQANEPRERKQAKPFNSR